MLSQGKTVIHLGYGKSHSQGITVTQSGYDCHTVRVRLSHSQGMTVTHSGYGKSHSQDMTVTQSGFDCHMHSQGTACHNRL